MPRTSSLASKNLRRRVVVVLDAIRPALQSDGGDVELVDISETGIVQVRLQGACVGCPSSENTLKHGIECDLRQQVPEIRKVVCVN